MSTHLVLVIFSRHAVLQSWQRSRLIQQWQLSDIETNAADIGALLAEHKKAPLTVVVDIADEELRIARVPKVVGSARRALLNRTLEQTFPAVRYRTVASQGTFSDQRREEQLLLLAITQNQLLDQWLQLLVDHEMMINCITTASLVFTELARRLRWRQQHQLLIYRHVDQGLRQLFLDKGQPKLSRLSPAPAENVPLVEQYRAEAEATRLYLNNSKALPRGATLTINILHREGLEQALRDGLDDLAAMDLQFSNITALANQLGIKTGAIEINASLLIGWCAGNYPRRLADFSTPQTRQLIQQFNRGQYFVKGALIATTAMVIWAATEFFAVWEISARSAEQQNLLTRWQQLQQKAIDDSLPTDTAPVAMKQSFELSRHFSQQRRFPQQAMQIVANAVENLPQLRFRLIEWAAPGAPLESVSSSPRQDGNDFELEEENPNQPHAGETVFVEFAIEPFDGDYLYAAQLANHTTAVLDRDQRVSSVQLYREPLEVDSASTFSEKIELNSSNNASRPEARFQLLVSLRPASLGSAD
ncbi:MAG TPA: hypothetical protein DCF45_12820 [Gammaproteobacteria bacterium]|nr:hypothetical protein [Gammaproteobacteria bacterium]